jgi:hypothetical protein
MPIILPKVRVPRHYIKGPLFFLLGPVLGGGDWQRKCCELLFQNVGDCWIVNPCRYESGHPLFKHRATKGTVDNDSHQLDWERLYLALANQTGCIIAWLPNESKTHPRTDGEPYACDTRGELGEWRGRMIFSEIRPLVLGADPGFPGLKNITRNFQLAFSDPTFPIYSTLEETVDAAIAMVGSFHRMAK